MHMHRRLVGLAIVAALVTAVGVASAAQLRGSDTATLKADFVTKYQDDVCADTPSAHHCDPTTGSAVVPGLGNVTSSYLVTVFAPPGNACEGGAKGRAWPSTFATNVLTVAGKGEIHLTLSSTAVKDSSGCSLPSGGSTTFPMSYTVTGGTGTFAGATGSGTFEKTWGAAPGRPGRDVITGTLTVPGLSFDLAAPTISGAKSRTVVVGKAVKRVKVVTKVTAQDAVDGPVATSCSPRSGSLFPRGRTRVVCSATDTSANTARAQFTITVK
jgi:hypothetical protein